MPLLPRKFSEAEWLQLNHLLSGGDLSACTKAELEKFATMLSRPRAIELVAGTSNCDAACSMIRTMLVVRMSEDQNEQAKRESRIALIISVAALLAGIVQVAVGIYQFYSDKPTMVKASEPLPVVIQQQIGIASPSPKHAQSSASSQTVEAPMPCKRIPMQAEPSPSVASSASSK